MTTTHLKLRHRTYFFRFTVPADVLDKFPKRYIEESLHTSDYRTAVTLAGIEAAKWRTLVDSARGKPSAHMDHALLLREALRRAELRPEDDVAGFTVGEDDVAESLPEEVRPAFYGILSGRMTPFAIRLEEWLTKWNVEPRTKAMARTVVQRAANFFQTVEAAHSSRQRQHAWVEAELKARAHKTVGRDLSNLRSYWAYLEKVGVIEKAGDTWKGLEVFQASGLTRKQARKKRRLGFPPTSVVALWEAALHPERKSGARGSPSAADPELAKAIKLAAYTGARIEELCRLTAESRVTWQGVDCLRLSDGKTEASDRLVPIHPAIRDLIPDTGYVIHTGSKNQYGTRSPALSKRFTRLKRRLGWGDLHTFHSIRHTVAALLEESGVPEGLTADLLGHEKGSITYGVYSSGHSVQSVARAVLHLHYVPGDGGVPGDWKAS